MAGHDHHKTQQRGRTDGKFTAPPLELAARRAEAARLRGQGETYRAIADQLGIDVHTAFDDVKAAVAAVVREPAEQVVTLELRRLDEELMKLDALEEAVRKVLETEHFTISHGKVIYVGDSAEPLLDDGPVLQAVDRLMRIEEQRRRNGESRRRLLGLDAPAKTQVSGGVQYEIVGIDMSKLT
jgi:hypothetical protein